MLIDILRKRFVVDPRLKIYTHILALCFGQKSGGVRIVRVLELASMTYRRMDFPFAQMFCEIYLHRPVKRNPNICIHLHNALLRGIGFGGHLALV